MSTPRILGLPFRPGVKKQIDVRQAKLAQLDYQPDVLTVFNSSTSFIRLSSAISIDGPERLKSLETNLGIGQGNISGYNLAKNLILWGGVNIQNLPGGVGYSLDNTYGFLSDGSQGLKPMPGITSMTSTYKNNGSLKEATIQIKCFTRKQFEAIEAVYLRLGYTMVLEWGHTDYFKNDESKGSTTSYSIINKLFSDQNITAEDIQTQIETNKQNTSYNYDGLLARVTNFNWTLNSDLSYDITLYLISWGDIIDSLKLNTSNNSSKTSLLKFTTENLPPSLFGIETSDPLAIPQGLVNILNNKSLSTLNNLFFDMYEVLIKNNLESFDDNTKEIIQNLNNQALELEFIDKINPKIIEWINEYNNFVLNYETTGSSGDETSISSFVKTLNSIKTEINSITTVPEFTKYWGSKPSLSYNLLLDTSTSGNLLSILKSKIKNKYSSPNNLLDTEFEDFIQNGISDIYRINL